MNVLTVCSVSEVDPVTRDLLSRKFGRPLALDQKLRISVVDPEDRENAWETIHRILAKASVNMRNVSDDVYDAAVEEAMEHVRPRHMP